MKTFDFKVMCLIHVTLTYLSPESFLWDIGKQYKTRPDAAHLIRFCTVFLKNADFQNLNISNNDLIWNRFV